MNLKHILSILMILNLSTISYASDLNLETTLPASTRIPITVYNTVSSDNLKNGDMISAVIRNDIKYNGVLFFKAGSNAVLNVEKSKASSGHGGAGLLVINGGRVIDTSGREYPISLSITNKGVSKRGWAVAATVLGILVILIPFGIWVEGGPATLQGGAVYDGLTSAPISIEK